jgi:hypothetical protein
MRRKLIPQPPLFSHGKSEPSQRLKEFKTKHLLVRWYDKQWGRWDDWREVPFSEQREKYGVVEEEWKQACKTYIEIGGRYEYRIVERTEKTEWEMSYEKV